MPNVALFPVVPEPAASVRRRAARDFRRAGLLAAAQKVFARLGLDGATIRAIALEAGYTPGAVYAYYDTKEAIYADILSQSLAALGRALREAAAAAPGAETRARAVLHALYAYYRRHPQDLDLGFYLFQGMRPVGLTRDLDRELNDRLIAVLLVVARALARLGGLTMLDAHRETVAAACHIFGVLLMENTGRLKTLDCQADELIDHYSDQLVARLGAHG
jgi:AcrR family transcriptional regulator